MTTTIEPGQQDLQDNSLTIHNTIKCHLLHINIIQTVHLSYYSVLPVRYL